MGELCPDVIKFFGIIFLHDLRLIVVVHFGGAVHLGLGNLAASVECEYAWYNSLALKCVCREWGGDGFFEEHSEWLLYWHRRLIYCAAIFRILCGVGGWLNIEISLSID